MKKIAVLGTGVSGFGAAHRLAGEPVEVVLYDKLAHFGGQTVSYRSPSGFIFDKGPHVSFTKDERIQNLFAESVGGDFRTVQYNLDNYWKGIKLPHPVQTNMHGLPVGVIAKTISDFVQQPAVASSEIKNYEDWLIAAYGRYFAEQFPGQYTKKYHTTAPVNLTTDWIGPRMYRPSLEEMIRGALAPVPASESVHYITEFRYPTHGGFMSYLEKWARAATMRLNHQVTRIDPKERVLTFANGRQESYDGLVSSIAVPDLIPLMAGAPDDVVSATEKLACSSCVLINIGVRREGISDAHISYYYDPDIVFSRTSSPHLMSPNNVPPGCSSVQAEIYFSKKYMPLRGKPEDYLQPTIRDLQKCGILREDDEIVFTDVKLCDYANIIFDHDRSDALRTVHGYLDDVAVRHCGRYGDWGYMWTDQSYKSGEDAATKSLGDLSK